MYWKDFASILWIYHIFNKNNHSESTWQSMDHKHTQNTNNMEMNSKSNHQGIKRTEKIMFTKITPG